MRRVTLTGTELQLLHDLQIKYRLDWPATFSINSNSVIWPYVTNGLTPHEIRENVRGVSPALDQIGDFFLGVRENGGRFFVDERGAFYKPDRHEIQFVEFRIWR